jgi:hypothetical protein
VEEWFGALGAKMNQIGFDFKYVKETLAVEYTMHMTGHEDAYQGFVQNDMYALEEFIANASDFFHLTDTMGPSTSASQAYSGGLRRRGGSNPGSGAQDPNHGLGLGTMQGSGNLPAGDGIVVTGLSGTDALGPELTTPINTLMTPAEVALTIHRMSTEGGPNWRDAAFVVLDVQRPGVAGNVPLGPLQDNLGRNVSYQQAVANILGKPVAERNRDSSVPGQWVVIQPQQQTPLSLTPRYRSGVNSGTLQGFDQLQRLYVLGQNGKTRSPRQELGPVLETTAESITFAAGDNLRVEIFINAANGPDQARQRFAQLGGQAAGAHLATALNHAAVVSPRPSALPTAAESFHSVLDSVIARGSHVTLSDVDNAYWGRAVPLSLSPRIDPASGHDVARADFLKEIRGLMNGRPADADTVSANGPASKPGVPHDADVLLDAVINDNANPGYDLSRAGDDSFHFLRAGATDRDGAQNIYIDAVPDHATKVMEFIVREIVDKPDVFDGVTSARIFGPDATSRRVTTSSSRWKRPNTNRPCSSVCKTSSSSIPITSTMPCPR